MTSVNGWRFCGNRPSVDKLRHAAQLRKPRHAFLISGVPSIGKRTLALRFAQSLLCERPIGGDPCFECGSCRRVLRETHPDVSIYSLVRQAAHGSKAGGLTIETARSISSDAPLRPLNGDWRFVIVDDAELLLPDAQEALLKTIEEPPPFMVLLLIASDLDSILSTIRSRCELLELGATPIPEITTFLVELGNEPALADAAASFSNGAPGWAIRAISDPSVIEERRSIVEQAAAWIESNDFERIATAFGMSDSLVRERDETMSIIEATAGLWRDSLLIRTGNSDRIVFRAHSDLTARLAGSHDITELLAALSAVRICLDDIRTNVRTRLALESMVITWPRMPTRS